MRLDTFIQQPVFCRIFVRLKSGKQISTCGDKQSWMNWKNGSLVGRILPARWSPTGTARELKVGVSMFALRFLSQTALQGCDYRSLPNPTAVVCECVRAYVRNAVCLLRRESVRTMKSMSSMYVFMYLRLS